MTWDTADPVYQDWCNSLIENAPEHYDGDDAQEDIIVRYVRDLEDVVKALGLVADAVFDGHLTAETADEDNAAPYCFECDVPWPCVYYDLAAALGQVQEPDA